MKTYIGTKILKATPVSRGNYRTGRGWQVPSDENPEDMGYLVQYEDGYISWSPTKQFEDSYVEIPDIREGEPPHQTRVRGELAQLLQKLTKLIEFTKAEIFTRLPMCDQEDLVNQLYAMNQYATCLRIRIARFS